MEILAATATPDDADVLEPLVSSALDELRAKRGGEIWSRTARRAVDPVGSMNDDLRDAATEVVLGTIDGVPLGYGVVRVDSLADGGRLGVVTDLYVDPEARGVGIGEAMMNHLVDHAGEAGCVGVDSEALPGDRHTKNFFESFGLVARSIVVHRSLA